MMARRAAGCTVRTSPHDLTCCPLTKKNGGVRSRCVHPPVPRVLVCAAALALAVPLGPLGPVAAAAARDAGFYPVSSRPPDPHPAPAVRFLVAWEAVIPGLPKPGPLEQPPPLSPRARRGLGGLSARRPSAIQIADGGSPIRVETREGLYAVDATTGAVTPLGAAPAAAPGPADPGAPEKLGRWFLRTPPLAGADNPVWGEAGMVALLAPDGTIYGRRESNGHLMWRAVSPHRISMPGGSAGRYLLVVPDASRSLEVYRWADGSSAGAFRLDSEDASFASEPVVPPDTADPRRIYVLAVQAPRAESRLLALRLEPLAETPAPSGR